ncbi:MAG: hypothetical protein WC479_05775 [Candidatus Izemoplasmatales bacterium]
MITKKDIVREITFSSILQILVTIFSIIMMIVVQKTGHYLLVGLLAGSLILTFYTFIKMVISGVRLYKIL